MKVSIFQPTYLPWIGFFKAIDWADKFVFLDDVKFKNRSWQCRNRIKSANGELMLTVPVMKKSEQKINEVKIDYSQDWTRKHIKAFEHNYAKTPFFQEYFPQLKEIFDSRPEKIMDLNILIIKSICSYLEIKTEFCLSSELGTAQFHKNEKIIALLKKTKATDYLYAEGAGEYMQLAADSYRREGITLIPLRFEHPVYQQIFGNFISHLSIVDLIFNCGREKSINLLKGIDLQS